MFGERQRNGLTCEPKVLVFHAEETMEMGQGVGVPRRAVNPVWLGQNGNEEPWKIMLKMQFDRGVESYAWQVK